MKGQYKSTGQLIAYYQVRITIKIVAHLKRKKKHFDTWQHTSGYPTLDVLRPKSIVSPPLTKRPKFWKSPQHISNTVFEQTTSSKVGNSRGSQSLSLCDSCLCPPFHNTRRSSSFTLYKPSKSLTLFLLFHNFKEYPLLISPSDATP